MFEVVAYVSKKLHTMSEKKEISVCMDYQTVEEGGGQRVYTEGVVIQMKMGLGCYAGDKLDMG